MKAQTHLITNRIRAVLAAHARLSADAEALSLDSNLYEAGMTSFASVNVMLALETEFDIEFPDSMLSRSVFDSISDIEEAISSLCTD